MQQNNESQTVHKERIKKKAIFKTSTINNKSVTVGD